MKKRLKKFLRELFCWHDMGLIVMPDEDEYCCHVVCPKCRKVYAHFHIPMTLPGEKPGQWRNLH